MIRPFLLLRSGRSHPPNYHHDYHHHSIVILVVRMTKQYYQQQPYRTAISVSERPQRFYWTVDVTTTTDLPKEAFRRLVRLPPSTLLLPSSSTSNTTTTTTRSSINKNDERNGDENNVRLPPVINDWYTVTLDGAPVKTPAGNTLAVPSRTWAYGMASEWNSVQKTGGIQPSNMPLMTLACTALDRNIQLDECMRYLKFDTLGYTADPTEDPILHRQQQRLWKKIHQWINVTFVGTNYPPFAITKAFGTKEANRALKRGLPHGPKLTTACRNWLSGLDIWHGVLTQCAIRETKSFMAGAALITTACSARTIQTACRVEEETQIDHWGLVEGQHDYDRLNTSIMLHAVSFATHCLHYDVVFGGTKNTTKITPTTTTEPPVVQPTISEQNITA